jgi:hypothetical protein
MKELKDISKQNPFKIPENYFEEVNRKILSETAGYDSGVQKKSIIRRLRPYLAVAASIAVLIVFSYTAIHLFNPSELSSQLPAITLSEFTDNYLDDVDILTLEEDASANGLFSEAAEFNRKDIIDYLVLDNIDIYDIYEHL